MRHTSAELLDEVGLWLAKRDAATRTAALKECVTHLKEVAYKMRAAAGEHSGGMAGLMYEQANGVDAAASNLEMWVLHTGPGVVPGP